MKRILCMLCLMAVLFVNVGFADEITLSEALAGMNLGVSLNGTVDTVYLTEVSENGARGGIAGQGISIVSETETEGQELLVFGITNQGELARTSIDDQTDTFLF